MIKEEALLLSVEGFLCSHTLREKKRKQLLHIIVFHETRHHTACFKFARRLLRNGERIKHKRRGTTIRPPSFLKGIGKGGRRWITK